MATMNLRLLSTRCGQCRVAAFPVSILETKDRAFLRRFSSSKSNRFPANPNARRVSPGSEYTSGQEPAPLKLQRAHRASELRMGLGGYPDLRQTLHRDRRELVVTTHANVISIVISPYHEVSIILVDALPPRIPSHCRIV